MSKTESSEEEGKTESKEKFSAKFQQPGRTSAKKRMKEKKYEEKKKISFKTDQWKKTEFLQTEEDQLILNYKTPQTPVIHR